MSVFEGIKSGLEEAIAYEQGTLKAKKTKMSVTPVAAFTPEKIKQIRNKTGLTQVMFANYIDTEIKKERLCTGITFRIEYTNNTTFGSEHPITSTFYKTYWIRHADDRDVNSTGVMEYAIVRNNIYQINVENISGRENDLNITVTTKDWTKKTGSTIEWD